jgi:hypothetical protein
VGSGNFRRRCVQADTCIRKQKNCHECSADNSKCVMCYNKAYVTYCSPISTPTPLLRFDKRWCWSELLAKTDTPEPYFDVNFAGTSTRVNALIGARIISGRMATVRSGGRARNYNRRR